jgi:hypothetical protein
VVTPYTCLEEVLHDNTDRCAREPLLMPSCRLGLSVDNTARPGRHEITMSAQPGAGIPAGMTGVEVWLSPDGGKTWTQAKVEAGRDHTFTVTVHNRREVRHHRRKRVARATRPAANRENSTGGVGQSTSPRPTCGRQ